MKRTSSSPIRHPASPSGCISRTLWTLLLSGALCPLAVSGQCVDYGDFLHWVGGGGTGSYHDVAVAGGYAYVVDEWGWMHVIDIGTPSTPQIVGSLSSNDYRARAGIVVAGRYAYVTEAECGNRGCSVSLLVIDVDDPLSPQIVGSVPVGRGYSRSIGMRDKYVYVAATGSQVDIADPSSPQVVGNLGTRGHDLAIAGSFAYVVGDSGLRVVDLNALEIVGSLSAPAHARRVAASGDHVYVGSGCPLLSGLHVIDVSDPHSPKIDASIALPPEFGFPCDGTYLDTGVAAVGKHVYVANGSAGLQVLDVSVPPFPVIVGSVGATFAYDVALVGDLAYVATSDGLEVVDISNPSSPPTVGLGETPFGAGDVALDGRYAYVTSGYGYNSSGGSLTVLDVGRETSPETVGVVDLPTDMTSSVAISGDYAYVTSGYGFIDGSLSVVDVSQPASGELVANIDIPNHPVNDVAVVGDHAYVTSGWWPGQLHVIDISRPDSTEIVATVGAPPAGIALAGEYAYLAGGSAFSVFDVTVPAAPNEVGRVGVMTVANGVAVAAGYAYVASGYSDFGADSDRGGRLSVIDVSNPSQPTLAGSIRTPAPAWNVAVGGTFAYVVCKSGVQVVDVSIPSSPQIVGDVGTDPASQFWGSVTRGVVVDGDLVYVAGGENLQILPTQCAQTTPVLLSGFAAEPRGRAVEVSWFTSFEYMHDGFNLYRSRSLTSGYALLNDRLLRGRSPYSYLDSGVRSSSTYYYKLGAVDVSGNEVLYNPVSVTTPTWGFRTALSPGAPNPFSRKTTLSFSLPATQVTRVAVYDVSGRLVRTIVNEELTEGNHTATWDGRDDRGLRVAGGTYFVRLVARDVARTRKVVYLGGK